SLYRFDSTGKFQDIVLILENSPDNQAIIGVVIHDSHFVHAKGNNITSKSGEGVLMPEFGYSLSSEEFAPNAVQMPRSIWLKLKRQRRPAPTAFICIRLEAIRRGSLDFTKEKSCLNSGSSQREQLEPLETPRTTPSS